MEVVYMDEPPGNKVVNYLGKGLPTRKVEDILRFEAKQEVVAASPHKSRDMKPAITIHYPGNPTTAEFGGEPKTLNKTNPFLSYRLYIETLSILEATQQPIPLTYEADHHGPTLNVPVLFYELGSDRKTWENEEYCQIMASSLKAAMKSKEMPSGIFLAIGGNHYARKFNELTRKKGYAYTHIIAKYSLDGLEEGVFMQALEKSLAVADAVLIDKKGTTQEQREKVERFCENYGIDVERV